MLPVVSVMARCAHTSDSMAMAAQTRASGLTLACLMCGRLVTALVQDGGRRARQAGALPAAPGHVSGRGGGLPAQATGTASNACVRPRPRWPAAVDACPKRKRGGGACTCVRRPVAIPLYAIHNSDHNWERPLEFRPERFLQVTAGRQARRRSWNNA